jgi:DNA (cytosine-5)-methyltransferase 1
MANNPIYVLSLFDGMSCGQLALQRSGFNVGNYFASEVDKHAIKVCLKNFPFTIQVGDVRNLIGSSMPHIDLIIGGSPCQSFSFAGKRSGMTTVDNVEITTLPDYLRLRSEGYQFIGQSYLFWEYVRLLKEVKPKYFLLENVIMDKKWEAIISETLGVYPIEIDSALVSAQTRRRLYWTNINAVHQGLFDEIKTCMIPQPEDCKIYLKMSYRTMLTRNILLAAK